MTTFLLVLGAGIVAFLVIKLIFKGKKQTKVAATNTPLVTSSSTTTFMKVEDLPEFPYESYVYDEKQPIKVKKPRKSRSKKN